MSLYGREAEIAAAARELGGHVPGPSTGHDDWDDELDDVMDPTGNADPYRHMNGAAAISSVPGVVPGGVPGGGPGGVAGGTATVSSGRDTYDPTTMERVDLDGGPTTGHMSSNLERHPDEESFEYEEDLSKSNVCCDLYRNILILACFLIILFPALVIWRETGEYEYRGALDDTDFSGSGSNQNAVKPLPSAPSNLAQICGYDNLRTSEGYQQCEEACEVSDCCEYPTTLDLSCIYGNELKCLGYHEQCVKLNYPIDNTFPEESDMGGGMDDMGNTPTTPSTPLPKPPENLPSLCSHDRLITADGYAFCRDVCVVAECCYDKDSTSPCTENPICDGYAPCMAMAALDTVDQSITNEVDTKCAPGNVLTVTGRDECLDACAHSLCCYAEDIVGPCPTDNAETFCDQYRSCENVFDVTADQIDTLCDPITGDEGTCMHLCFPARCCFSQGQCFDDVTEDDCDMYASCSRVFPEDASDTTTTTPPPPPPTQPPQDNTAVVAPEYTEDVIRDACLNHNNNAARTGRLTLCDVVCQPGQCCFDNSIPTNQCSNIDCTKYESCKQYDEQTYFDDLNEACAADEVNRDASMCVQLCVEAACCYTIDPRRSCYETNTNILCANYQVCDIIYYPTDNSN